MDCEVLTAASWKASHSIRGRDTEQDWRRKCLLMIVQEILTKRKKERMKKQYISTAQKESASIVKFTQHGARVCANIPQWFKYTLWTKACCTAPENCSKSIKYLKESQVQFMFSLTFYKSLYNRDLRKVIHHPLSKIHYHCYLLIRPLIYSNWQYILKLIG